MIRSILKGFSFGLTSGIITTLGLIVGLDSGTHSKTVVLGGIFTIAIADAFSDALGIHVSEESTNKYSQKEVWESTLATFISKFLFALTFVIPVLLFQLQTAVYISVAWGLLVLAILSQRMAKSSKTESWKVIGEHLLIACIVIATTYYVGKVISIYFT